MITFGNFKNLLSWRKIGCHLCTLAVALSFNNTWRTPREAFRYGGLQSLLLITVASALVAVPVVLLHLAVGQLSQQDAVGIWKAVPFFKGVGFLRLLISFLCSIYSMLYLALSVMYIFHTLNNSISYGNCAELLHPPTETIEDSDDVQLTYNVTACLKETFLAPVDDRPEYYVALAFIVIVFWIVFPFILYNPVKLMKRMLYVLGPLVLLLAIIIVSVIGNKQKVELLSKVADWKNYVQPSIWHGALVQALLTSQTAGGYLISSGESIYADLDVQWNSLIFVATNIVASWAAVLFWFAIGGEGDKETGNLAVLMEIYKVSVEKNLSKAWPLLCFAMLTLSGIITMLTFLHPLYDRYRRVGGYKWRHVSMGSSAVSAVGVIALVSVGGHGLEVVEDVVVPFLVSVATVLEISAFVFIYGWKVLVEDIEFLTGRKIKKIWVMSWCAVPGIIVPVALWWTISWFIKKQNWTEAPWEKAAVVSSVCVIFILFFTFAAVSVSKQVQYDFIGKLKSSFSPSRHWGPRDPITHHYWLASREEGGQSAPPTRYQRRQLGQFSGSSSFNDVSSSYSIKEMQVIAKKRRSNSDDWLVLYRKHYIAELCHKRCETRKRSKSLDWAVLPRLKLQSKYHSRKNIRIKETSFNAFCSSDKQ
ncbi:sodium-dependent nutrient amino acid transporter 1-like [Vanessa atalanta]|uniref:sodium-dependent nutrient amino acid transporter 1-like n=1 Tax=Vanessa atalanta TaxID=42275 RepID=UPI001FCD0923|nr:sodium-dependent nutrient amino acid transporter 1-like [Vanessa atalanta]